MTEEEYNEKLKELIGKQAEAYSKYVEAKHAVNNFKKEYVYGLAERYQSKIGKKVVVHYKTHMNEEATTPIGFLKQFRWYSNDRFVETGLYPILTKPKQDGSMSNREFPEYDNTRAEITRIVDIEEVL